MSGPGHKGLFTPSTKSNIARIGGVPTACYQHRPFRMVLNVSRDNFISRWVGELSVLVSLWENLYSKICPVGGCIVRSVLSGGRVLYSEVFFWACEMADTYENITFPYP